MKAKLGSDLEERTQRHRRRIWTQAQRESRKRKKRAKECEKALDTQPVSPSDFGIEEQQNNRQHASARERAKTRKKHSRKIKKLTDKIDKLTKEADKLREHLYRRKNSGEGSTH